MMEKKKLSLVIPCYNEALGIPQLVEQLTPAAQKLQRDYDLEFIFVDDGSTDTTNELLHQHFGSWKNTLIMKHDRNRNLGAALRTGFAHAHGELIACLDSDCTYPPTIIHELAKQISPSVDIVTVSPYHPLGTVENVPGYRLLLSRGVSVLYHLLLGTKLYTYTAMVRVYKREVIQNIRTESDSFMGVAELLAKSILHGYRVAEYPTMLRARKFGTSKMKLLRTIQSHLVLLGKIARYRMLHTGL